VIARLFFTVVALAVISGMALIRVNHQLDLALGTLTDQVPERGGVVTFVLSDARAAYDPFLLFRGKADTAGDWIGGNLIGGPPAVQTQTALIRAFADSTQLVSWTHDGFRTITRKSMSRDLEKAILKARAAGAVINIVAQGPDAAVVIETLQRTNAAVNKVILLGVNTKRLKLDNVAQLANVWTTREIGSTIQIQMIGGRHDGETADLEALWPGLSSGADSVDKSMRLIRLLIESPRTLDDLIEEKQALASEARFRRQGEAAARAKAAAEAEAARTASRAPAPAVFAPAAPRPAEEPAAAVTTARGDWSLATVLDYDLPQQDTGWLFEGPVEKVLDLAADRRSVALVVLKSPGVPHSCEQFLQLSAFPASKLGPGDHDAAIQSLFESSTNGARQHVISGGIKRLVVHGRPASRFTTGGDEGASVEFFVVETGRDVIYLTRRYYRANKAPIAACVNAYRDAFQRIADSLRPAKAG